MSSTFLTEVRDTARQPARSMPPKKPAKPFAERMQLELQHKLRLLHIPAEYYEGLPLKPGLEFWDTVVKTQTAHGKGAKAGKLQLAVPIAETVFSGSEGKFLIHNDAHGVITCDALPETWAAEMGAQLNQRAHAMYGRGDAPSYGAHASALLAGVGAVVIKGAAWEHPHMATATTTGGTDVVTRLKGVESTNPGVAQPYIRGRSTCATTYRVTWHRTRAATAFSLSCRTPRSNSLREFERALVRKNQAAANAAQLRGAAGRPEDAVAATPAPPTVKELHAHITLALGSPDGARIAKRCFLPSSDYLADTGVSEVRGQVVNVPAAHLSDIARWIERVVPAPIPLELDSLTADFIKDERDQWLLLQVKAFEPTLACYQLLKAGDFAAVAAMDAARDVARLRAKEMREPFARCHMCGCEFPAHVILDPPPPTEGEKAAIASTHNEGAESPSPGQAPRGGAARFDAERPPSGASRAKFGNSSRPQSRESRKERRKAKNAPIGIDEAQRRLAMRAATSSLRHGGSATAQRRSRKLLDRTMKSAVEPTEGSAPRVGPALGARHSPIRSPVADRAGKDADQPSRGDNGGSKPDIVAADRLRDIFGYELTLQQMLQTIHKLSMRGKTCDAYERFLRNGVPRVGAARYATREVCRTCFCIYSANVHLEEAADRTAAAFKVPSEEASQRAKSAFVESMRTNKSMVRAAREAPDLLASVGRDSPQRPGSKARSFAADLVDARRKSPTSFLLQRLRASVASAASVAVRAASANRSMAEEMAKGQRDPNAITAPTTLRSFRYSEHAMSKLGESPLHQLPSDCRMYRLVLFFYELQDLDSVGPNSSGPGPASGAQHTADLLHPLLQYGGRIQLRYRMAHVENCLDMHIAPAHSRPRGPLPINQLRQHYFFASIPGIKKFMQTKCISVKLVVAAIHWPASAPDRQRAALRLPDPQGQSSLYLTSFLGRSLEELPYAERREMVMPLRTADLGFVSIKVAMGCVCEDHARNWLDPETLLYHDVGVFWPPEHLNTPTPMPDRWVVQLDLISRRRSFASRVADDSMGARLTHVFERIERAAFPTVAERHRRALIKPVVHSEGYHRSSSLDRLSRPCSAQPVERQRGSVEDPALLRQRAAVRTVFAEARDALGDASRSGSGAAPAVPGTLVCDTLRRHAESDSAVSERIRATGLPIQGLIIGITAGRRPVLTQAGLFGLWERVHQGSANPSLLGAAAVTFDDIRGVLGRLLALRILAGADEPITGYASLSELRAAVRLACRRGKQLVAAATESAEPGEGHDFRATVHRSITVDDLEQSVQSGLGRDWVAVAAAAAEPYLEAALAATTASSTDDLLPHPELLQLVETSLEDARLAAAARPAEHGDATTHHDGGGEEKGDVGGSATADHERSLRGHCPMCGANVPLGIVDLACMLCARLFEPTSEHGSATVEFETPPAQPAVGLGPSDVESEAQVTDEEEPEPDREEEEEEAELAYSPSSAPASPGDDQGSSDDADVALNEDAFSGGEREVDCEPWLDSSLCSNGEEEVAIDEEGMLVLVPSERRTAPAHSSGPEDGAAVVRLPQARPAPVEIDAASAAASVGGSFQDGNDSSQGNARQSSRLGSEGPGKSDELAGSQPASGARDAWEDGNSSPSPPGSDARWELVDSGRGRTTTKGDSEALNSWSGGSEGESGTSKDEASVRQVRDAQARVKARGAVQTRPRTSAGLRAGASAGASASRRGPAAGGRPPRRAGKGKRGLLKNSLNAYRAGPVNPLRHTRSDAQLPQGGTQGRGKARPNAVSPITGDGRQRRRRRREKGGAKRSPQPRPRTRTQRDAASAAAAGDAGVDWPGHGGDGGRQDSSQAAEGSGQEQRRESMPPLDFSYL